MFSLNSELKKTGGRNAYNDFPALNDNFSTDNFGSASFSQDYAFGDTEMQDALLDDGKNKKKQKSALPETATTQPSTSSGLNLSSGTDGGYRPLTAIEMSRTLRTNSPWKDFTGHISPVATTYRLPALYAQSQKGLDDFVEEYFNQEVRPLYDAKRKSMEDSVKGSIINYKHLPDYGLMYAMNAYDPMKAIDETIAGIDEEKLRLMVAPLARDGGFDADTYINEYVKPSLRSYMVNVAVEDGKPKESSEYILKSTLNNSLIGKLANLGLRNRNQVLLENESLARYDANSLEKILSGVGGLLIDAPLFSGLGALSGMVVGRSTSMITNRLANRLYSYTAAEGMSRQYATQMAERVIVNKLGMQMVQNSAMQGLVLGNYDVAHSVVDDILYYGEIDSSKAAAAFTKACRTR